MYVLCMNIVYLSLPPVSSVAIFVAVTSSTVWQGFASSPFGADAVHAPPEIASNTMDVWSKLGRYPNQGRIHADTSSRP